mmetsp:Transcript_76101/g.134384  ORF Transcript_76101/g.134384 Transcript_76101/m.134384 type:complete len:243 (+) Transcript_76101:586-1314(+)
MIANTIEAHLAATCFYSCLFLRKLWLVILGERFCFKDRARIRSTAIVAVVASRAWGNFVCSRSFHALCKDTTAVTHMSNVHDSLLNMVKHNRCSSATSLRVHLAFRISLLDKLLGLREGRLQSFGRVRHQAALFHQDPGEDVLDELRHTMSLPAVAIKNSIECQNSLELHADKAVLIRQVRLQTLKAGVANAFRSKAALPYVTQEFDPFRFEGLHIAQPVIIDSGDDEAPGTGCEALKQLQC